MTSTCGCVCPGVGTGCLAACGIVSDDPSLNGPGEKAN
ncbi:hypothetical protein BBR47_42940 [Brevibacillus brevis NBRC 100599]|uniref:Uncharacterized protein n=1 Tax=Brevibacillus brevis (strain 47 / JCM 6285 / NBRC 100599) TaxID=358681 RepID=C0ZHZ7_BREBN|nr:hypothetical protein BBR47_42940 [Brevibacillus brevis NBRC 100599]